jgi:hypothetical protein
MKKYYFTENANVIWTRDELKHTNDYLLDNSRTGRSIDEWIALSIEFGDLAEVEEER